MKKIITTLGITIIGLGLSANIAFAQTVEAPATLTLQQQYQATLVTLIGLLQQQVQNLLAQLQAMQTKIDTSTMTTDEKVDLIVGRVNDIASKLEPVPATQVQIPVNKELRIEVDNYRENENGLYYDVYVYYTENGEYVKGVSVTLSAPGTFYSEGTAYEDSATQSTHPGVSISGKTGTHFQFVPRQSKITLTATANGVTTTKKDRGQHADD